MSNKSAPAAAAILADELPDPADYPRFTPEEQAEIALLIKEADDDPSPDVPAFFLDANGIERITGLDD